jgi:hypothetical protein
MGNGSSSSSGAPDNDFTELDKTDRLLTPDCVLDQNDLKSEWAAFLVKTPEIPIAMVLIV